MQPDCLGAVHNFDLTLFKVEYNGLYVKTFAKYFNK